MDYIASELVSLSLLVVVGKRLYGRDIYYKCDQLYSMFWGQTFSSDSTEHDSTKLKRKKVFFSVMHIVLVSFNQVLRSMRFLPLH